MSSQALRTFVLFGIDNELFTRGRLVGVTRAPDFATAAKQLGGTLVDGDATVYAIDSITIIGNGEVRIFDPGTCTAEVLVKAIATDALADRRPEAEALERTSGYLHGARAGFLLCTAPEVMPVG